MTPCLARILDISLNNPIIPSEWDKAIVTLIYKGGDGLALINSRPV